MARRVASLALCLALAGMALGAAAPASAGSRVDSMQKWWNSPRMVEELKLTPPEKERLDQLFLDFRRIRIENRGKVQKEYLEIEAAFEKEPLDEARAKKAFRQVEEAKLASRKAQHAFMLEVRRLLGHGRYVKLKGLYKEYKTQGRQ